VLSSLRCIKNWIAIYYRGLNFPQKAVVLLLLESDAACASLNCHSARKHAVFVSVWCCKCTGDREQILWIYWSPEGCINKWYDKPKCYGCLCKRCGLQLKWSSDFAVSRILAKHSDIQSENTGFKTLWFSPLTRISIYLADKLSGSFTVYSFSMHFVRLSYY